MNTSAEYEVAGLERREIAFLRNHLSRKKFEEFAGLRRMESDRGAPVPHDTPLTAIPAFSDLPHRILEILASEGMALLSDVVERTEKDITSIPGIGPGYRKQIFEAVRRSGRYVGERLPSR